MGITRMGKKTKSRPAKSELRKRATRIHGRLKKLYPGATCALRHQDAFELLMATILSAQCTDDRVNMVTPTLFKEYPNAASLAKAKAIEIEKIIKSTGFYRNKTKSLIGASKVIANKYDGHVPDTMDELLSLPGVARKTANVVLGNAYGKNEGVVVDTHVSRLSQRIGLSRQKDPKKIEQDLMPLFPRKSWTQLAHLLIFHGRNICNARKPQCADCKIFKDCPQIGVK